MILFQYGFDSPQFGTALLSFAAAFLSLFLSNRPVSARQTGARAVAIALLAALSVIMGGPMLLTVALLVFAAGDAFLVQDTPPAARIGLVLLAVGQCLYAALAWPAVDGAHFLSEPIRLAPAIAFLLAAFFWLRIAWSAGNAGLHIAAAIYPLLATASAVVMLATPLVALAWGALLLALAAFFLAAAWRWPLTALAPLPRAVSWALFYFGHLLIALSALALL